MNLIKFIFKSAELSILAKLLGLIGTLVLALAILIYNPLIDLFLTAPNLWLRIFLILLLVLFLVIVVLILSLRKLLNPYYNLSFDAKTNTYIENGTDNRFCPTCILENKKSRMYKSDSFWLCSNKNCKNSNAPLAPTIGKQW
jgi:hypothetical protein